MEIVSHRVEFSGLKQGICGELDPASATPTFNTVVEYSYYRSKPAHGGPPYPDVP
jgi:hypothetical protein